ncbi:hypothetical protein [Hyphomicrobium sulfonivorans]|uniref:hypothetical protein n=1 Tax=Hyphomicrobium sulfonivorans TaxID=121290 RepID=UPI00156D99E7|nr:hypothetical protein [Hyphomicrobium sulfonivorans]MBI1648506.1 hypothetical protein [Hyphomicrobium sulfonivorans]
MNPDLRRDDGAGGERGSTHQSALAAGWAEHSRQRYLKVRRDIQCVLAFAPQLQPIASHSFQSGFIRSGNPLTFQHYRKRDSFRAIWVDQNRYDRLQADNAEVFHAHGGQLASSRHVERNSAQHRRRADGATADPTEPDHP